MSAVIPIECEMYGWDSPECNYLINEPALTFGADIPMDYRFSQQQVDELLRGEMVIDYEWMSFDRAARNLVLHEQIMCSVDPCVDATKTFSIENPWEPLWSIPAFADLRYALLAATQTPDDGYIDLCEFEPMNCCPEGTVWINGESWVDGKGRCASTGMNPDPVPREGSDDMYGCLAAGFSEAECYGEKPLGAFTQDEIKRLLRGERIAPMMAKGDNEMIYDAARNVLIAYRPGTDEVVELSLDDPNLDPRFQVFKEAAQSSGGTGLIIAAVAGLLLLSNRR